MTTHRTLADDNLTDEQSTAHDRRVMTADLHQVRSARLARPSPDQAASSSIPTSFTADPPSSNREGAGSAVGTVAVRVLTVLVAAMVVTAIIGLTAFDPDGGNATTAIISLAIGGFAAVVGMTVGFMAAYRAS